MKIFPAKRTVKRWGIGLAIVVGVLLIINGVMSYAVESRMKAAIEAVRAEGDPASIAELEPEPIPDEENAATQIDKLTPRLEEFSKEYGRFYQSDAGKALDDLKPGERPTAEQIAAMRAILDKYSDVEQMLADAAAAPRYASTADFNKGFEEYLETELPRMSRLRDIARMVDWRVQVLIADGRREEAVAHAVQLLRLAKLQESEPTIVNLLITIAVRGVALHQLHDVLMAGPVSIETHQEIDSALASQADQLKVQRTLRTERAIGISASIKQQSELVPSSLAGLIGWPVTRRYVGPLEYYDRLLRVADRPWPELKPMFAKGGKLAEPTELGVLADLLAPAMKAAFESFNRDVASIRSLRVINALQLFALENGREATGLGELDLPPEATTDPFTGKPLVVRHAGAGWYVYSVGDNEVDDGGDWEHVKDFGFGPSK